MRKIHYHDGLSWPVCGEPRASVFTKALEQVTCRRCRRLALLLRRIVFV